MPAAAPTDPQAEAQMLARYCAMQRREYLHEVECNIHRGPDEAEQLREHVAKILAEHAAAVR